MGRTSKPMPPAAKTVGPGAAREGKEIPARGRRAAPTASLPAYGELARTGLGDAAAADHLRGLVDIVARAAVVERRETSGAARRRALSEAGRSADRLGRQIARLDDVTLLRVVGEAARSGPTGDAPGLLAGHADEPLHRRIAVAQTLPQLFKTLGERLQSAAADISIGNAGRPRRSDALVFGLEALLTLWRQHGCGEPTQGTVRGRFGALAGDLFAGPPCGFGAGAVRHAVAALLPARTRSRARPTPVPVAMGDAGGQVVIVGVETPLGRALAEHIGAQGPAPLGLRWAPAVGEQRGRRREALSIDDLADASAPKANVGSPADVVFVIPPSADEAGDDPSLLDALAVAPHRALDHLLRHAGEVPPRRIVLLAPVLPRQGPGLDRALRYRRAARVALASLVATESIWLRERGAVLAAVVPAWGTSEDGMPIRISPQATAALLAETAARLTLEQAGRILDLHGSELPF